MVSSRLSPLQHDVVEAFFSERSAFFLTGGAALAGFYLGHRTTDDLDLFSPATEPMELAVQRLRRAAAHVGAEVDVLQEAPEFRRFSLRRGADLTLVDLVIDRAPQLEVEKQRVGNVSMDSPAEIAANKVTALLGRTAPRDLVDLFALLDHGHDLTQVLRDARIKDGAVDPGTLAWVLSNWRLGPSTPLPEGVTMERVEHLRTSLIERLLVLAAPAS